MALAMMSNFTHAFGKCAVALVVAYSALGCARADEPERDTLMSGYLLVPNDRVADEFDAGFSMYVAAWPLLEQYPGNKFQTGLFGTWMFAKYDDKPTEKLYSDIEGGLGWWRDTQFATPTPKFIMGAVALGFSEWANGPGAGKGRDWDQPKGKYGVVQLSPNVLWPPDGLNLKQGTCGELFGYGYLPLPLIEPSSTTAGADVPTGNQCWTLFLSSGNFKGPVAFVAPYFWSRPTVAKPELAGRFLDLRPSDPNRALQMETQFVPAMQAQDAEGNRYARVAPMLYPIDAAGESAVVHRITSYNRRALWDDVSTWFAGGAAASGEIRVADSVVHKFSGRGGATWGIHEPGAARENRILVDWQSFATPIAFADDTFGYQWNDELVGRQTIGNGQCVSLPEFYRLDASQQGKPRWRAIRPSDVPPETKLAEAEFQRPTAVRPEPYVTPDDPASDWKSPGPSAGPFTANPGDGSEVTYYWYRFADQPAMLNADLTDDERESLQRRVELIHKNWTKDRQYLPPPERGELADIDAALIVTPPPGMEIGYVPIATRQALKE